MSADTIRNLAGRFRPLNGGAYAYAAILAALLLGLVLRGGNTPDEDASPRSPASGQPVGNR